jgi:hypothetical protein
MKPLTPSTSLRIPVHWEPTQAVAVLDFLEDLHAAIWDTYEERIVAVELAQPLPTAPSDSKPAPDTDDDLPF